MKISNILSFNPFKKRKLLEEQKQKAQEELFHNNIQRATVAAEKTTESSTKLGREFLETAKKHTAIGESLNSKSGQLIDLIKEYENIQAALVQREVNLRKEESDLDERKKNIREKEIDIAARGAEARRQEAEVTSRHKKLTDEIADVEKRENTAKKLAADSRVAKENFDAKQKKLDAQEKDYYARVQELDMRQNKVDKTFKEAGEMDEKIAAQEREMAEKARKFEETRVEIEKTLKEKIEEYDRKIADMKSVTDAVDAVKFDSSKEGKNAKIAVQDAIMQAKKNLQDNADKFGELQEKYCEGSFRGFSILIEEIDGKFEELKNNKAVIENHARDCDILSEMAKIIDVVDSCIENTDKFKRSWNFPDAYRQILKGLATCESYELLVEIYAELHGAGDEQPEEDPQFADEPDYYDILGVSPDASEKEIEEAWRKKIQKHHSDKGGDVEHAQNIMQAREILLDKKKREAYDDRRRKAN